MEIIAIRRAHNEKPEGRGRTIKDDKRFHREQFDEPVRARLYHVLKPTGIKRRFAMIILDGIPSREYTRAAGYNDADRLALRHWVHLAEPRRTTLPRAHLRRGRGQWDRCRLRRTETVRTIRSRLRHH